MGLMDFVKDVGRQIFDTDAEAANNIRQHLEIKAKGINGLSVEFSDGTATLTGECSSQEMRDVAILIAGCIKGVEHVDAATATETANILLKYRSDIEKVVKEFNTNSATHFETTAS